MITEPAPVSVSVEPVSVAGPDSTLNTTGRPEDVVAVRLNGASPKVAVAGRAKTMDWLALETVKVLEAEAAP